MAKGRSDELSSFMQSLDVELMCGICLEFFECPIMLPCGHNFCRKCIHGVIDSGNSFSFISIGPPTSFNCPVCQGHVNMSAYGVDNLPVNKPLESIIALYRSFSPIDIFDFAWNSDINIDLQTCPDHKEPMNKYCGSCSISMCKDCEKESHKPRHKVTSLIGVASTLQADIADTLTELKKKTLPVYERINLLHNMLQSFDIEEQNMRKCLTHNIEALMSSLRAKQEELSDGIIRKMSETALPINDQLRRCKLFRTKIQEMMKKLSAIRKIKDANQRIKLMKDSILQLNILLQDDSDWSSEIMVPDYYLPEMKLDTQEIAASVGKLQWNIHDPGMKTMCTTCTQTEHVKVSDQTCHHSDKPTVGSHYTGQTVHKENRRTSNAETAHITHRKPSKGYTAPLREETTDRRVKRNSEPLMTNVTTSTELDSDTNQDSVQKRTTVCDSKEKSNNALDMDKQGSDVNTDEEIDLITNRMSKQNYPTKSIQSSGRKSFPLDSFSRKSPVDDNSKLSPKQNIFLRKEVKQNRSSRTPPKDSTSEALASFVARRRTLSPFPPVKTKQRVSTSPLTRNDGAVDKETEKVDNMVGKATAKADNMVVDKETTKTDNMVVKETTKADNLVVKETLTEDAMAMRVTDTFMDLPGMALSKNYTKESISIKLDFETDV